MAPAFEYEALDLGGRARKGVVTADTARLARAELRRLQLTPVALAPARDAARRDPRGGAPARIKPGELVAITQQLAVLLDAATPLAEALSAVALQTDSPGVRKRLLAVRERVTEGWRFAEALREDPKSFPELYCAVVAAGETSGDLAPVLERLATMLEKNRAMRNKALGALVYPAALFVFAGGVVAALMTQVVPRIIEQFQAFDAELPLVTRIVVGVSGFLANFGVYMLLAALILGVGLWRGLKVPAFKRRFDRLILRAPVIGPLLRGLDGARFARTLATLFGGGAPLLDSLTGAQRTVGNLHIRARLDGAIEMVREGGSLAKAVKRAEALPPMMTHMVAAGERAGALPKLLEKAANQLEEEFDAASGVALRLLEPLIIVVMGVFIMMLVVSIMLPIPSLNSLAAL